LGWETGLCLGFWPGRWSLGNRTVSGTDELTPIDRFGDLEGVKKLTDVHIQLLLRIRLSYTVQA